MTEKIPDKKMTSPESVEKSATPTRPTESQKPNKTERAGRIPPAETPKAEKPVDPVYIAAQRVEHITQQWQTSYQPRLLSTGEHIHYFRDRHERHEGHEKHGEERGRGLEGAKGRGRHMGHSADVEGEMSGAIKKSNGAISSLEAVEAGVAIKAAKFGEKGEKSLSSFEKFLIARFEKGEKQARESHDGQFHFLKKTAAEWMGFFENFVSRTIRKVVNWGDVQGFLFRGLLQQKGAAQQGMMISDVMTAGGIDKFARIPVTLGKVRQFAAMQPGAMIGKEAMQSVVGEQLRYLAVAAAITEDGAIQFGRAASRGMFSSQQLENRVAEHLGLVSDFRGAGIPGIAQGAEERRTGEGRRRRGGMWSRFFGGEDVEGEGSVFIPWWRWDREERTGFRRWFVAVFSSVIFIVLFFLIVALVRALRPG